MSNIDHLTYAELKGIAAMFSGTIVPAQGQGAYEIGKPYLIRTVTMIQTGRVVAVTDQEIVLEEAAWIADTGRFSDSLKSLQFVEVEPFPDGRVIVGRAAVVDACQISATQRSKK